MTDSTPATTLPPDFLSGSADISLNRIDFSKTRLQDYKGYYAVVLDNVLSPDECQLLVKAAEAQTNATWEPAMVNAGCDRQVLSLMVRNCGRIMWDSADVAAKIWRRVEGSLPELQMLEGWANVMGNGPVRKGEKWRVARLNERMRFLKYGAGQYFRGECFLSSSLRGGFSLTSIEHADGAYVAPNGERSFFTLHLYLNDASSDSVDGPLEGGATTFWSFNMAERLDVPPKNGRVLIFQQRNLLHSGEEVTSGVKLTMRTDMMFEKVKDDREGGE